MLAPILGGLAIAVGLLGFASQDEKKPKAEPKGEKKPAPKAKDKGEKKKPEDADAAYARGVAESNAKTELDNKAKSNFEKAVADGVAKQIADAKKLAGVE